MNKELYIFGILGMFLVMTLCASSVYAYDASTPYTVTMNFIVGEDTSFTAELAGAETTIDFNPTTLDSKEVEPDSQNAGASTPILTLTNTGNIALNFTNNVTAAMPSFVEVSSTNVNSVDWSKTLSTTSYLLEGDVATSSTVTVYMWANFTAADAGTTVRTYQVNSLVA